jgi:hypothetical protein
MLFATELEIVGHGAATIAVPRSTARLAVSQRLLRRMAAACLLLALAGIGLAFPML